MFFCVLVFNERKLLPHIKIECLAQMNHCMIITASPDSGLVRVPVKLRGCERVTWFCEGECVVFKVVVYVVH